ncbi:hypothetical protein F5X96DRAFT_672438 [Biscogniauxia mediterranea]|nr:hypothetical protein F5X96DRAFT_672438 [Biscogniauxia mediterranea]
MQFSATTIITILLAPLAAAASCSVESGVQMTFYGSPDNDPPGSTATAHDCGVGRGYQAGGSGTHDDPLTFASSTGEYAACEVVYSPYLRKYLRMEDDCAQCISDWNDGGKKHIDIWTGNAEDGGQSQIQCENDLTPGPAQAVIRSPDQGLPVDNTALWSGGSCHTDHVYLDNNPQDYCGGGGGSGGGGGGGGGGTAPSCQTGCSWAGHCIGCSCTTYDDCSDDYVCTGGVCVA